MRSAITKEIDKLEDIQLSINHASIFFDKTSKELLLNVPTSIIHISEYGLLTLCSSLDIESQDFDYCLTLVSIVNNDKFLDNMDAFIQLLNILKIMDNEELEFIEEYLNDLDNGIKSYEAVKAFTKEKNISYSKELKTIWILLAIIEENYDSKFNILKDLIRLLKIVKEENINKYINSIKFTKECPIKLCINGVVDEMHSECLKELLGEEEVVPNSGVNIKLFFPKEFSNGYIITSMARSLDIDFSIVWGKLEKFRDDVLGSLIINIPQDKKEQVINYLNSTDIKWEVLQNKENKINNKELERA